MRLIPLSILQALLLCLSQAMLKYTLTALGDFRWSWAFVGQQLINWRWMLVGVLFTSTGLLWMYLLRHFPFSQAYPLSCLAYVFGMLLAVVFFHEPVGWSQWVGVLLILAGCALVAN